MSAHSSHVASLTAGIFAAENGQRFLQILLALGDRAFSGLYEKCKHDLAGAFYQNGLRRVHKWSDDVILEDIAYVTRNFPDIEATYDSCFVSYVSDRYRGQSGRPTARTPPLVTFTRGYMESLGEHESLGTGEFFARRDPVVRRIACMDAGRQALYGLLTAENVRVELLSEVGGGASRGARPLAEASEAEVHAATMEVRPDDSVSNVGAPRERAAREPSVVSARQEPRAPSVVSRNEPREPSVVSARNEPREPSVRNEPREPSAVSARDEPREPSVVSARNEPREPSVVSARNNEPREPSARNAEPRAPVATNHASLGARRASRGVGGVAARRARARRMRRTAAPAPDAAARGSTAAQAPSAAGTRVQPARRRVGRLDRPPSAFHRLAPRRLGPGMAGDPRPALAGRAAQRRVAVQRGRRGDRSSCARI